MADTDWIVVEAVVRTVRANAMLDHFASGTSDQYDCSELEVFLPGSFKGQKLAILYPSSLARSSPLRKINQRLRFSLQKSDLAADRTLFDGALCNLSELDS
jgi:hypothetical protein